VIHTHTHTHTHTHLPGAASWSMYIVRLTRFAQLGVPAVALQGNFTYFCFLSLLTVLTFAFFLYLLHLLLLSCFTYCTFLFLLYLLTQPGKPSSLRAFMAYGVAMRPSLQADLESCGLGLRAWCVCIHELHRITQQQQQTTSKFRNTIRNIRGL
jgi:hypothetical protein